MHEMLADFIDGAEASIVTALPEATEPSGREGNETVDVKIGSLRRDKSHWHTIPSVLALTISCDPVPEGVVAAAPPAGSASAMQNTGCL
jgi:hypothetical protein